MSDRSVVRNRAYTKAEFSLRERHNERLNESYFNSDILPERRSLNVHFKQSTKSYAETFDEMLANGVISTRGQKSGAKVFDEFVFDVNSEYFDKNGGYEYAKSFFEEAYRLAIKETGGEEYILSAVMHADERNIALSEQYGRDVFHYHLHVVYIPIVDKDILWSKRCKNPELVGKVKETIKQVSHSKKWPRIKTGTGWLNSYSLLQDRFHDHMKAAGFDGFERGERGSTTEHLETLEYKIKQDKTRATLLESDLKQKEETKNDLDVKIANNEKSVINLEKKMITRKNQLAELSEKITNTEKVIINLEDIEKLGNKRTMFGAVTLPDDIWIKVLNLVKEAFNSRDIIKNLRKKIKESAPTIMRLEKELAKSEKLRKTEKASLLDVMEYNLAKSRAPIRLAATIADIKCQPPENKEQNINRNKMKAKGTELI